MGGGTVLQSWTFSGLGWKGLVHTKGILIHFNLGIQTSLNALEGDELLQPTGDTAHLSLNQYLTFTHKGVKWTPESVPCFQISTHFSALP